jgi:hypothetical protein
VVPESTVCKTSQGLREVQLRRTFKPFNIKQKDEIGIAFLPVRKVAKEIILFYISFTLYKYVSTLSLRTVDEMQSISH